MRLKFILTVLSIMLLNSCNKNNTVVNFNCTVNGTAVNGNGVTYYNSAQSTFQITMTGAYNQAVTLVWYNIGSIGSVNNITARSYTLPANALPPFSISGTYASMYGALYNSGQGNNLGGNVTITSNSGPGGTISGTFYFNGLNQSNRYDTVHIASGTFTNIPVVSN
jgi:Family of unknown function (DUF6252)